MSIGDPTGADLVSGTTNGNTLPQVPAAPEEREIDFGAGIELTSGVAYAIVAKAPDAGNIDDAVWAMAYGGGYSGGSRKYSSDSGVTWSGSAHDLWFETYAAAVLKDYYQPAYGGFGSGVGIGYFSAQTFIAASTYTITKAKVKLYRQAGESPGTITVSIRAIEIFTPPSDIITYKRLVAAANSKIWYEDI